MNIFISDKAKLELYSHSFYKRKYSKSAYKKFLEDFDSSIQSLLIFPYMYPKVSKNSSYRKILFNKKYKILYSIKNDCIYIDSIINCKQNYIKY